MEEIKEDKPVKQTLIDTPVDFWTNFSIFPRMLDEIKKKGVVVYEQ